MPQLPPWPYASQRPCIDPSQGDQTPVSFREGAAVSKCKRFVLAFQNKLVPKLKLHQFCQTSRSNHQASGLPNILKFCFLKSSSPVLYMYTDISWISSTYKSSSHKDSEVELLCVDKTSAGFGGFCGFRHWPYLSWLGQCLKPQTTTKQSKPSSKGLLTGQCVTPQTSTRWPMNEKHDEAAVIMTLSWWHCMIFQGELRWLPWWTFVRTSITRSWPFTAPVSFWAFTAILVNSSVLSTMLPHAPSPLC